LRITDFSDANLEKYKQYQYLTEVSEIVFQVWQMSIKFGHDDVLLSMKIRKSNGNMKLNKEEGVT